mmetsp:Transcript_85773/g.229440  ORF Transcript_85773/g.229440 Transcript_85773/m.229440 type:complete len:93 (-) Transcript_85773:7-285(-)
MFGFAINAAHKLAAQQLLRHGFTQQEAEEILGLPAISAEDSKRLLEMRGVRRAKLLSLDQDKVEAQLRSALLSANVALAKPPPQEYKRRLAT